jgi:hypothetical protein
MEPFARPVHVCATAALAFTLLGACAPARYVVPDTVSAPVDEVGTWRELVSPVGDNSDHLLSVRGGALFVTGGTFYVSVDRGATFHPIEPSFPYVMLASHGRRLFGGHPGAGVGYSDDDGYTFFTRPPTTYSGEAYDSHLSSTGAPDVVRAVRVIGERVYAACQDGLYVSGTSRLGWSRVDVCGHACDVRDIARFGDALVVSTAAGLFASDDGRSFRIVQAIEASSDTSPRSLAANDERICAAWHPRGVLCASRDLSTWAATTEGFSRAEHSDGTPYINALDLAGGALYVATNAGLFVSDVPGAPVRSVDAVGTLRAMSLSHDEAHVYVWAMGINDDDHLFRYRYR